MSWQPYSRSLCYRFNRDSAFERLDALSAIGRPLGANGDGAQVLS